MAETDRNTIGRITITNTIIVMEGAEIRIQITEGIRPIIGVFGGRPFVFLNYIILVRS